MMDIKIIFFSFLIFVNTGINLHCSQIQRSYNLNEIPSDKNLVELFSSPEKLYPDINKLSLPNGIVTSDQLLQNLRSLLNQTFYDYTQNFTYDLDYNSISYHQNSNAKCSGQGPLLTIKYGSSLNISSTQRRDFLEVYGCENQFLFKEIVISNGQNLKKVSPQNMIYGKISESPSLFLEEKGLQKRIYKLFYPEPSDLPIIKIEQTYGTKEKSMKFKILGNEIYRVEEKFSSTVRSVRFTLHKNSFKVPSFVFNYGKININMGQINFSDTYVVDILVRDIGAIFPKEEYYLNMNKTHKDSILGFINNAIYFSLNNFKNTFFDFIIVERLLPAINQSMLVQETRFLKELKELKVFLNQSTPDSLEKAKNRINEYILGIENNTITVTDKRP